MSESTRRPVAFIHGAGNSLGHAVGARLAGAGVALCLADAEERKERVAEIATALRAGGAEVTLLEPRAAWRSDPTAVVRDAAEAAGGIDHLANLFVPTATTTARELHDYPLELLARCLAAKDQLAASSAGGTAVTHCFLPAMYDGTPLDDFFPMVKGAVTGVTRTLARRFAARGVVVNCVQTGLVDMPETRAMASEKVRNVKVPAGRWGTPEDVAKLVGFLLLRKGYTTGQCIVLDGGLTSGLTGT